MIRKRGDSPESLSTLARTTLARREFLTESALMALLAGVTVTIGGCGDSNNPTSPDPTGGRTGSVIANHGHTAVITAAQLNANADITLDIRGSADHPHTVVITMAELGQITSGQRVTKTSSTDPSASAGTHSHPVQFN